MSVHKAPEEAPGNTASKKGVVRRTGAASLTGGAVLLTARELKRKYLEFFKTKSHAVIPGAPLIPEHDPTVLFTTAGMHPLVPFLMGQPHPLGTRVVNVQKCLRTQDIDEVGDETHTTCFEMLGNWSFGDYFKKEAITWSYEFLTSPAWLGLAKERLAFTCFAGDADAPRDDEAAGIWRSLGVPEERIAFLPKKDNWWGPAGATGPCGPDTEMFYWKRNDLPAPDKFDPEDDNWVEIWNDVFMQYEKQADGSFIPLRQRNVDTGMGVERVAMVLQGKQTIFDTELFLPVFAKLQELSGHAPDSRVASFRIIADHIRAATFILGDERGVVPSNVDQGYILRRFIRRSIRHLRLLGVDLEVRDALVELADAVIGIYADEYPLLAEKRPFIHDELRKEQAKFLATLEKGMRVLERELKRELKTLTPGAGQVAAEPHDKGLFSGATAFLLFQSYGFPLELTREIVAERGLNVDEELFQQEYQKHQKLSRVGAEQKFKGGLSDSSEATTKLHTATHLLNEALRKVVSPDIRQRGSNITPERLRFDFNFDRKLTSEELKAVEVEVNRIIALGLPVTREETTPQAAIEAGAQAEFGTRYPEKVSVYRIGDYSQEICMGPHVANTRELGRFRILKEESSAAGVRRIKAVVE